MPKCPNAAGRSPHSGCRPQCPPAGPGLPEPPPPAVSSAGAATRSAGPAGSACAAPARARPRAASDGAVLSAPRETRSGTPVPAEVPVTPPVSLAGMLTGAGPGTDPWAAPLAPSPSERRVIEQLWPASCPPSSPPTTASSLQRQWSALQTAFTSCPAHAGALPAPLLATVPSLPPDTLQ